MKNVVQRVRNTFVSQQPVLPIAKDATENIPVANDTSSPILLRPQPARLPSPVASLRLPRASSPSLRAESVLHPPDEKMDAPVIDAAAVGPIGGVPARGWSGIADKVSGAVGTPWAFATAVGSVIVWLAAGPPLHWNNTWQLIMNTAASIIAYLMVFLLQTAQNRDTRQGTADMRTLYAEIVSLRADLKAERDARAEFASQVVEQLRDLSAKEPD